MRFQKTNSTPIDFRLQDLNGANISLSDFRGKWILINFWATWCGPCRMEMPTLESLHQEFKDENFVILGVSVDQGMSKQVDKFIKRNVFVFIYLHFFLLTTNKIPKRKKLYLLLVPLLDVEK